MTNMPFMLAAELCVADENPQMRAHGARRLRLACRGVPQLWRRFAQGD